VKSKKQYYPMKKTHIIITLLIIVTLIGVLSCNQKRNHFSINIDISPFDYDSVYLYINYSKQNKHINISQTLFSGKYHLSDTLDQSDVPTYISVSILPTNLADLSLMERKPIFSTVLFMGNEEIDLTFKEGKTTSSGSIYNDQYQKYLQHISSEKSIFDQNLWKLHIYSLNRVENKAKIDSITNFLNSIKSSLVEKQIEYLSKNEHDYFSQEILNQLLYNIPKTEIEAIWNTIPNKYKTGSTANKINSFISKTSPLNQGDQMINLSVINTEKDTTNIYSFLQEGKYLLLEFTGISCNPCNRAIPELKEIYAQHNERIEILSCYSNDNIEDVTDHINRKMINWNNVLTIKPNKEFYLYYGIEGIPKFFLLNPDGTIKYIWSVGYNPDSLKKKLQEFL
jgi:thiol-disulfide isomerase/thioredoxin